MVHTTSKIATCLLFLLSHHVTQANLNPLMVSRTALLRSIRKVNSPTSDKIHTQSSGPSSLCPSAIDEWYDNGCDELLQASMKEKSETQGLVIPDSNYNLHSRTISPCCPMEDGSHEERVKMCSVSVNTKQ
jgi:hypothetical protein